MRRYALIAVVLAVSLFPLLAASASGPALPPGLQNVPPEALSLAISLFGDSNQTATEIMNELNASASANANGSVEALLRNHSLVIVGNSLDAPEKALLEGVRMAYPLMRNLTTVGDTPASFTAIDSGKYAVVILVGGSAQNRITQDLMARGVLNESDEVKGEFVIRRGTLNHTLIIAFSDKRGFDNAPRRSVEYSPLSAFIPAAYVPAAATGISAVLLSILGFIKNILEAKTIIVGKKGKKFGVGGIRINGFNLFEPLAVFGGAAVVGVSMSWQYFALSPDFLLWAFINTLIALTGAMIHEIIHRLMAFVYRIKVEYRFWWSGSALTLFSSYLGNAFSVQGFLLEEVPKGTPRWKLGTLKLAPPLFSAFIMLAVALLNAFVPHPVLQMIYISSAMWAMTEMFPFNGMSGKDVWEWNRIVWLLSFLLVAASYVFVMFIL